jgi:hypothetical protein
MRTNAERRAYERLSDITLIVFSYFNKKSYFDAQILNYCAGGICFKSSFSVQPGTTVYIRVTKFYPNGSLTSACGGLRSVTLAEVKWCSEILDANEPFYGIGVKYYDSDGFSSNMITN